MPETRRLLRGLILVLGLLLPASLTVTLAAPSAPERTTDRWYEIFREGRKVGHTRVVWAPSTWRGRATVHDTTTVVRKSVRTMMGIRDEFRTETSIDLERGADGTLWWMKLVVEEGKRSTIVETTWTGEGYVYTTRIGDVEEKIVVPLEDPVMIDSEAFLAQRIREGKVAVGNRYDLRLLDVEARGAHTNVVEILAREEIVDASATKEGEDPTRVPCFKVRERDPRSGEATLFWLDDDGAFVKLATEGGITYRRVGRDQAEASPVRAAAFSVTTPATPVLERIMNADRLYLDLHLQGDPDRPLPRFPDSPWSRVEEVNGSDDEGWVVKLRLSRHDDPEARASRPADAETFERELAPTALMPCRHERIQDVVREVVGDEEDAHKAAALLARWVCETLSKQSPEVAQADALQILREGKGDCSEHALLFVTLCRGAGIPARSCSGYVCIGSQWGAHAWSEIWVGKWISADPTTGEVGGTARYLFFGYHDDPESFPGVVSARARGRMRFVATRIEEGAASYDLEDRADWHLSDEEAGRYVHVLAGIELHDVPSDWTVRMIGANRVFVRGPDLNVDLRADADQGFTLDQIGGGQDEFGGVRARKLPVGPRGAGYLLHSRRRIIQMLVRSKALDDVLPVLEKALAPTFAETAPAWSPETPAAQPQAEEEAVPVPGG